MVHPLPTPSPTKHLIRSKLKEQGRNQKLKLFKRGKIISGTWSIIGIIQFPNPPMSTGMIKKKIITRA